MSASRVSRSSRSAGAAALALISTGDLGGLARRLRTALMRRRTPLPTDLKPLPRAAGDGLLPVSRDRPIVLMIGTSLQRDGAPLSQFELATGLAEDGFEIEVASPADGPLRAMYGAANIPVSIRPELACSPAVPGWYERDVARLAEVFIEKRPDLVFASTIDSFPAIDAARVAGIPSVWNIRESEPWRERLADRHVAIAARALACFSYPQSVLFVAKASEEAWRRFIPVGRSHVVGNAPHPDLLTAVGGGPGTATVRQSIELHDKLVVSVGTLCPRKGQIDLAQALNSMPGSILQGLRVVFIGRSEWRYEALVRKTLTAEAAKHCIFMGPVTDAIAWIAAADVLVNTSRSEAFPRSFIEAAAAGTPIIAANVDGASERLSDGRSALFYQPGDIKSLVRHLSSLLSEPSLGEKLAEMARADLIDAWTFDEMTTAYESKINQAIADARFS